MINDARCHACGGSGAKKQLLFISHLKLKKVEGKVKTITMSVNIWPFVNQCTGHMMLHMPREPHTMLLAVAVRSERIGGLSTVEGMSPESQGALD